VVGCIAISLIQPVELGSLPKTLSMFAILMEGCVPFHLLFYLKNLFLEQFGPHHFKQNEFGRPYLLGSRHNFFSVALLFFWLQAGHEFIPVEGHSFRL
jgi:hypothetical protein